MSVVENCVEICLALGKTRVDVLVDMYLGILADRELAVRRAILASLPRLAGALLTLAEMDSKDAEKEADAQSSERAKAYRRIMQSIVPAMAKLVQAPSVETRMELVNAMLTLLELLDDEGLPITETLNNDESLLSE